MTNQDKQEFAAMISGYLAVMHRKMEPGVIEIWWRTLERWSIVDVSNALQVAVEEGGNPIPATVIKYLPDLYGHLKPEDAWNAAQKDEDSQGAYMTQEMLNAVISCSDSLERGDMIGARKCFLEVYEQNVKESKRNRRPAKFRYFQPLRVDYSTKLQIEAAQTQEAKARGWITKAQADTTLLRLEQLSGNSLTQRSGAKGLMSAESISKNITTSG